MSLKRYGWRLVEFWLGCGVLLSALAALADGAFGAEIGFVTGAATIATTAISDTVFRADGTAASGTVLISWPAFTNVYGANVPAGSTSVTLGAGGALNVNLVPNAWSTPIGSYYTVVYHLDDGSVTHTYWVVPVRVGTVTVSAISTSVLPLSVAQTTVSQAYVDTAIAAAVAGAPLDTTPYVLKAGDTMTGPLVLPADPTTALQASDKNYVDTQVASVTGGLAQKVSTVPQGSQAVAQPAGTQLSVDRLNGAEYASQYGDGVSNGIATATSGADCAGGCDVVAEQTYAMTEMLAPLAWNNRTRVEDHRGGTVAETVMNPANVEVPGLNAGRTITVNSTEPASQVFAESGSGEQFSLGLVINQNGLEGGSNEYPKALQGTIPYFKSTYGATLVTGRNNTLGQHVLNTSNQTCYGVGDCLAGGMFVTGSGGFRDDADEGTHPFDLQVSEDRAVFEGTCGSGCTAGSTALQVNPTAGGGTQGDGRYLLDKSVSGVISTGALVGGVTSNGRHSTAVFTGTKFSVSTFLETAASIPTQANNIEPGTVTVSIVTSGVPAGYSTNTAALPSASGVACVSDAIVADGRPLNYETAEYTTVDGSHLSLTLIRPHGSGATIAVGGLCGFGLEQTVDTTAGIRQVFPVIGSTSDTQLLYAGGASAQVGQMSLPSAFVNLNLAIASISRNGNVVTVTTAGVPGVDVNGLTLTVAGVTDPSYNGSFAMTTTSSTTFTYMQTGANSTSSGGSVSLLTGGFALYPMAEVLQVYNPVTRAIDGQMKLAANTVNWAAGDALEQPHYFQEKVSADLELVTQYTPRPVAQQQAGISYQGNNGPGLRGWAIFNTTPASNYFGNGGTHNLPDFGMQVAGPWLRSLDVQAGDEAVVAVHCNSHGCGRWNSGYNLFEMDSNAGQDRLSYSPLTSALSFSLRGTGFTFDPSSGFTTSTVNVNTLNAQTLSGTFTGSVAASSLPVFGASGGGHAVGAVPDPGATAGTTRFLREDGTWAAAGNSTAVVSVSGFSTTGPVAFPQRSNLLGEYLLSEGTGTVAHDTSGQGNDGTISGATWEGTTDLNFTANGDFVQLPAAVNAARAWQIALYAPVFGSASSPQAPGYGLPGDFGDNPSVLCGTDGSICA